MTKHWAQFVEGVFPDDGELYTIVGAILHVLQLVDQHPFGTRVIYGLNSKGHSLVAYRLAEVAGVTNALTWS